MKTTYKNKTGIVLETAALRTVILPEPGAKMASLVNKETGYEYMLQREGSVYRERSYAGSFVEAECSGYDDMFPTIDECFCEQGAWKDIRMPDHGEVWSLPWTVEEEKESEAIVLVHGIRFPYCLRKRLFFPEPNCLQVDYELKNESPFVFDYLWAGHLMLNLQEGTRIEVPSECREAVSVLSKGGARFGESHQWPYLKNVQGERYPANVVRSPQTEGFEKIYFMDRLQNGWCRLHYPDGNILKVAFTTKNVPYLGLLINEKGDDNLYTIIVEPCSIGFDRPDLARKFGQRSVLPGKGSVQWSLQLSTK